VVPLLGSGRQGGGIVTGYRLIKDTTSSAVQKGGGKR